VDDAVAAVARSGGEISLGSPVLGLWTDGGPCAGLLQYGPRPRLRVIRPRTVILATGTHAQPPAFEDSDLPGVLAARGLLVALAEHGTVPGERAAVLGGGPEADAVSARLGAAGMQVVRVRGEPLRAFGRGRVAGLELPGAARVECDTVVVATARAPAAELPRLLGAPMTFDDALGGFRLEVGADGRIAAGVHVAGEVLAGGRGGERREMTASEAAESGRRAATAALSEVGRG
jgi:sarcosine oxidase subunit alpha